MKKNFPYIFYKNIIKEFISSLLIFTFIITSLVILINFIEELFFLKELKNLNNLYLHTSIYALLKTPGILLNLSHFIFLFSAIHFFVKIKNNNEFLSLKISGISNFFIILTPASFSFFLGVLIITIITPFSSKLIGYYENQKKNLSGNNNLFVFNDTGIWVKEETNGKIIIYNFENFFVQKNKTILKNVSILSYNLKSKKVKFLESKYAETYKKNLLLFDMIKNDTIENKESIIQKFEIPINFNMKDLDKIFSNSDAYSLWNISGYIKTLNSKGYYGDELIIKFHKYLSLPILLFSTVIFSTLFTININKNFQNYTYAFFGVATGTIIYFLSDFSIALGKSSKIPLVLSVWMPIILILIFSLFSLLRSDEA